MKSFCRISMAGVTSGWLVLAMGVLAARGGNEVDDPAPLAIGSGPAHAPGRVTDDALAPDIKLGADPAAEQSPLPGAVKKPAQRSPAGDTDRADYSPEDAGPVHNAKWLELVESAQKKLDAQKPAGSAKKEAGDFFVIGTIDLEGHKAIVDYPIQQGLRKAAEKAADFMAAKPAGAIRVWKEFGRAKNAKAAEVLQRKARSQSIEGQLEAFKPAKGSGRKTLDDFFVVGTAEVFPIAERADVRFQVVGGTQPTASFLLDFILRGTGQTTREWHVFFRAKTQDEADKYIAQLRNWYDTLETQRAQIAQIYHAKTTRRC
ncbi:MAG: hypothetical protein ABSF26_23445 [Thermoguttaceae bacterium]|jgi:hypothetical protein